MTTGGPRRLPPGGRPRGRGRRFFPPRRRVCAFCVEHVTVIDYKDAGKLRRYLSETARIDPRRKTGTCAAHQRQLSMAIKRARHLGLLPFVGVMAREPFFRDRRGPGVPPSREPAPAPQSVVAQRGPAEAAPQSPPEAPPQAESQPALVAHESEPAD